MGPQWYLFRFVLQGFSELLLAFPVIGFSWKFLLIFETFLASSGCVIKNFLKVSLNILQLFVNRFLGLAFNTVLRTSQARSTFTQTFNVILGIAQLLGGRQ